MSYAGLKNISGFMIIIFSLIAVISCQNPDPAPNGLLGAPIPGTPSTLDTQYPKATSQTITWFKGTDNADPQSSLQYKLVRSGSSDIATVADIETLNHGTVVMNWTPDIAAAQDPGLIKNTDYYYNVLIKDTTNHISAYTMTLLRTPMSEADVFVFSPGDTLANHNFTGINLMEPITADGYMLTSTTAGTPSKFTTPIFSDLDRTSGNGFRIEWKIEFLASHASSGDAYSEGNRFRVILLNRIGQVLYTISWAPIPATAVNHDNRYLYLGSSTPLNDPNYYEQLIYPTGLNPPIKWVSYRSEFNSSGINIWDDLTVDYTTTDGNPVWTGIPTQIASSDTTNNHVAKIQFQYAHSSDYSIEIRDFKLSMLP